jgi:N-acetylglucosamine-6-sulfatase
MRSSSNKARHDSKAKPMAKSLIVLMPMLGLAGIATSSSVVQPSAAAVVSTTQVTRPNILLVITDDQLDHTVRPDVMPNVYREMAESGVTFDNGFVSNSWCCPSRASILTGQYSGHNGVWTTGGKWGIKTWRAHESSTLATWLHDAGYRTGILGKYFNGFAVDSTSTYTPPGWDTTAILMNLKYSEGNAGFYNYQLWENGQAVSYGSASSDYSTRVFTRRAQEFIRPSADGRPWFLYLAFNAPHGPATPDPLDLNAGAGVDFPMPPSVCEADVSDKPAFIRNQPLCSMTQEDYARKMRTQQAKLLESVDRGMGAIFDDLRSTGQLANTLVIFSSDNGHQMFEHRIRVKELPYEESIDVPILARWDALGSSAVGSRSQLAVNIDFAPTIVEAAEVAKHDPFDGRSLLPAMADPTALSRSDFLIEHKMVSIRDNGGPSYCGVRTSDFKFVEYETGERELYDLRVDPYEMESKAGRSGYAATEATLHSRMLELCQPPPPGWVPL